MKAWLQTEFGLVTVSTGLFHTRKSWVHFTNHYHTYTHTHQWSQSFSWLCCLESGCSHYLCSVLSRASATVTTPSLQNSLNRTHQQYSLSGTELVKVKVKSKVTLRLAVYHQSIGLGIKPDETHDQRYFQLYPWGYSHYIIFSLKRGWFVSYEQAWSWSNVN
jgi:hypothetical protein